MPYCYEHVDGTIHHKPDIVVDSAGGPAEYFAGPFVKRWWYEAPPDEPHYHAGFKPQD